jgi:DNA primase
MQKATISRANIDHVKEQTNLLKIIGQDTTFTKQAATYGGTLKGPCPFCGGVDRFHAHQKAGNWWCRQCGRKGDVFSYWMQRYGVTFTEAYRALVLAVSLASVAPQPAPVRWLDPEVSRQVSQWPPECWPVTLYADNGTRPVVFNNPAELQAVTI